MKKLVSILLVIAMCFSLVAMTGCQDKKGKLVELPKQTDALREVAALTSDVAILDSVMGGYYTSTGSYKDDLVIVEGLSLAVEEYGIGFRVGSKVTAGKVNRALYELQEAGKIAEIAKKYNLTESLTDIPEFKEENGTDAEWEKIKSKKIIVGYTEFAPIAYKDKDGKLIGYDIELAEAVFEKIGIDYEFQEINWATKEMEIAAGNIDVVWNGFTITEERKGSFEFSTPYLDNKQIAIVRKADAKKYATPEDLKTAIVAVEKGSAGAALAAELFEEK